MSSKTASVKLTLEGSSYVSGMRRIGDVTTDAAKRSSKAWDAARAGLDGMKRSAGAMLGQLKSMAGTALTFGGALGAGKLVQDTIRLNSTYRDLAFRLNIANKSALTWKDIQQKIAPVAERTFRTSEELAGAFDNVFGNVGDAKFAEAAIGAIGTLATASGRPVSELADIASSLGEKFGVSAEQIPDALSAMIEFGNRGGVQMEELARTLDITGASAHAAGLKGEDGFRKMLAMANTGGDALGTLKKGLGAITQLVDRMVDPSFQKQLKLEFGISTVGKDGKARDITEVLGDVFKKTRGNREKLGKLFTGEQLKLVTELGKPFQKAFEETSGNVKEKTAAGLKAYQDALKEAGSTTFNFAAAQKEAEDRAKGPAAQYRQAMEKLAQATQKPEIIDAIKNLAENLPKLAEAVSKFISFASKSPIAAGGALVGGKLAFAGLEAAIVSAFEKGGQAGAGSFGGALKVAGPWAGIALLIGAGIIDAVIEANMKAQQERDQRETERIQKDFQNLSGKITQAREKFETGKMMSPEEARLANGKFTAAEQSILERGAAEQLGGLPQVEDLARRKAGTGSIAGGQLAMAGETAAAQAAFAKAGLLGPGTSGLVTSPEGQRLVEAQGKADVKLGPEAGAEVGRNVANALSSKTLKVEITNGPTTYGFGGGSGSRGSLIPSPIVPGYAGGR